MPVAIQKMIVKNDIYKANFLYEHALDKNWTFQCNLFNTFIPTEFIVYGGIKSD